MLFCILVHDYTLCFIGSPYCSVSYYVQLHLCMTLLYSYSIVIHILTVYILNQYCVILHTIIDHSLQDLFLYPV